MAKKKLMLPPAKLGGKALRGGETFKEMLTDIVLSQSTEITDVEETPEGIKVILKQGEKQVNIICPSAKDLKEILSPSLKGKFTQRWLKDSDTYYYPIFLRLRNAFSNYAKRNNVEAKPELLFSFESFAELFDSAKMAELYSYGDLCRAATFAIAGISEYNFIESSINSYNRSFYKLLESAEPLAAMALVRLQLDNLTYLAAELKYPFKILHKVYFKKKRLSQIQIKGKALNPSAIRKELDEQHGYRLCELYDRYSSYIHPDQMQIEMQGYEVMKKIPKKQLKPLTNDMIEVNQIIAVLLQAQIFALNTGLISNEESQPN